MNAWTWRTMVLLWIAGVALILAAGKLLVALDKHWYAVAAQEEAAMAEAKHVDISGRDGMIIGLTLSPSEARVLNRPVRLGRLATTLFACVALADLLMLLALTIVWLWIRYGH